MLWQERLRPIRYIQAATDVFHSLLCRRTFCGITLFVACDLRSLAEHDAQLWLRDASQFFDSGDVVLHLFLRGRRPPSAAFVGTARGATWKWMAPARAATSEKECPRTCPASSLRDGWNTKGPRSAPQRQELRPLPQIRAPVDAQMPDRLHLRLTYIIPNPRLRPTNFRERRRSSAAMT